MSMFGKVAGVTLLALALGQFHARVFAEDMVQEQDECQNVEGQGPRNRCYAAQSERVEAELNGKYQELLGALDGHSMSDKKKDLINVERLWVKFKEANCTFEGNMYEGGTLSSQVKSQCLTREAKRQTQVLNGLLGYLN